MASITNATGSAGAQARLWGARAGDWADHETRELPKYMQVIDRVSIGPGTEVLDVGCGSGVFLRAAADLGARVSGLDATSDLVELARQRVPGADLRVGEMEALPFADDTFDLVTGFNSFFFASDMVAALREARRVAKPGGTVVIQVWGDPENCELTPVLRALGPLRPPRPAPTGPPLHDPGVLEAIAGEAGLTVDAAFSAATPFDYPDEATMVRCITSAGGATEAIDHSGLEAVRAAVTAAAAPCRQDDGGYRFVNEWRFVITRA